MAEQKLSDFIAEHSDYGNALLVFLVMLSRDGFGSHVEYSGSTIDAIKSAGDSVMWDIDPFTGKFHMRIQHGDGDEAAAHRKYAQTLIFEKSS